MNTWLHIFMGLYLASLRIIALLALGVNSLMRTEEHSVWYNHEAAMTDAAPSRRAQGNDSLQLLYPPPALWSSLHRLPPHMQVMTDWLTHSCSEFLCAWWLQTKNIGGMRDKWMTTVSLDAFRGLTHWAVAQSSSQFVDAEHLPSNPEEDQI